MSLSKQLLDDIKSSVSILDFASSLKGFVSAGGVKYKACCPFHEEKTPSFYIDASQQFFHCFGCGAGGDIIHLTQKLNGVDFVGAVQILADRAGIKIEKSNFLAAEAKEQELLYKIFESAVEHYKHSLKTTKNQEIWEYIKSRKISQSTIDLFDFGFANGGSDLYAFLKGRGFQDADILKSGLVKEKNGNFFDFFFGRVTIPIRDGLNRAVGFGARLFQSAPNAPKYINSQESPIFKKSQILFNFSAAKMSVLAKKQKLVVVEGYMDCIMAAQFGHGAVVAPLGTSITVQQIKQLMTVDKSPVICFNSDGAGMNAMVRCAKMFLQEIKPGSAPSFMMLKTVNDVDELLLGLKPDEALGVFHSMLGKSIQLQDFLWNHISSGIEPKNPNSMSVLETEAGRLAELITDPATKKSYTRFFKDKIYQLGRTPFRTEKKDWNFGKVEKAKEGFEMCLSEKTPIEEFGFYRFYAIYSLVYMLAFPFCLLYLPNEDSAAEDLVGLGRLKGMIMDGYFFEFVPEEQEDTRWAAEEISTAIGEDFRASGEGFDAFLKSRLCNVVGSEEPLLFCEENISLDILSNEDLKRDVKTTLRYFKRIGLKIPNSEEEIIAAFDEIKQRVTRKRLQDKIDGSGDDHKRMAKLVEEKARLSKA